MIASPLALQPVAGCPERARPVIRMDSFTGTGKSLLYTLRQSVGAEAGGARPIGSAFPAFHSGEFFDHGQADAAIGNVRTDGNVCGSE
jgi:hypothetical protein